MQSQSNAMVNFLLLWQPWNPGDAIRAAVRLSVYQRFSHGLSFILVSLGKEPFPKGASQMPKPVEHSRHPTHRNPKNGWELRIYHDIMPISIVNIIARNCSFTHSIVLFGRDSNFLFQWEIRLIRSRCIRSVLTEQQLSILIESNSNTQQQGKIKLVPRSMSNTTNAKKRSDRWKMEFY